MKFEEKVTLLDTFFEHLHFFHENPSMNNELPPRTQCETKYVLKKLMACKVFLSFYIPPPPPPPAGLGQVFSIWGHFFPVSRTLPPSSQGLAEYFLYGGLSHIQFRLMGGPIKSFMEFAFGNKVKEAPLVMHIAKRSGNV